jgi:hypothetical protein
MHPCVLKSPRSHRAVLLSLALLTLVTLSGCTLPMLMYANVNEKRASATRGKEYISVIQPAPAALTEELAAAKAKVASADEGYKNWFLTEVRTRGNRSIVRFTKDGRFRMYSVRLEGERILCQSFRGTQRDWQSWSSRPKADTSVARGKTVAN